MYSTITSYQRFYHCAPPTAVATPQHLLGFRPVQMYGMLSGTRHGYGFFAPNVASQYVSVFTLYQAKGAIYKRFTLPTIYSSMGKQRYSVWMNQFQYYVENLKNPDGHAQRYRRYLHASVQSLCRHLLSQWPAAMAIDCSIYLHRPPPLQQAGTTPAVLQEIYQQHYPKFSP